jgi:acetylornithine deacetylase/succinyl-diaminopimelate desuccinylase-like protein
VDARDIDLIRRDNMLRKISAVCDDVAVRRQLRVRIEPLNADAPAQCAPDVVDVIAQACEDHHLTWDRMISRAYHDSLFLARIARTAMIFIPSRSGFSHRPDEYSSPEAIGQGTLVLAETLVRLAGSA